MVERSSIYALAIEFFSIWTSLIDILTQCKLHNSIYLLTTRLQSFLGEDSMQHNAKLSPTYFRKDDEEKDKRS